MDYPRDFEQKPTAPGGSRRRPDTSVSGSARRARTRRPRRHRRPHRRRGRDQDALAAALESERQHRAAALSRPRARGGAGRRRGAVAAMGRARAPTSGGGGGITEPRPRPRDRLATLLEGEKSVQDMPRWKAAGRHRAKRTTRTDVAENRGAPMRHPQRDALTIGRKRSERSRAGSGTRQAAQSRHRTHPLSDQLFERTRGPRERSSSSGRSSTCRRRRSRARGQARVRHGFRPTTGAGRSQAGRARRPVGRHCAGHLLLNTESDGSSRWCCCRRRRPVSIRTAALGASRTDRKGRPFKFARGSRSPKWTGGERLHRAHAISKSRNGPDLARTVGSHTEKTKQVNREEEPPSSRLILKLIYCLCVRSIPVSSAQLRSKNFGGSISPQVDVALPR